MAHVEQSAPKSAKDVIDALADAQRNGRRVTIQGGGSKADIGAASPETAVLDMRGFSNVIDYDPAELVLTAGAATPLTEIQALVAAENQMLAFDPFDHGPIFGRTAGAATIGGVVAAGVAGSQRLTQGGARDHLLGFEAVSGRLEKFVAGAKVVKNVTGYDLPKLAAGSWGRLFAMTQVTLKVLPAPRVSVTKVIDGLGYHAAQIAMARALGSQTEVAAAAHLPGEVGQPARTVFRLQGFGPSVAARAAMLDRLLSDIGPLRAAAPTEALAIWSDLRTLAPLAGERPLWRINVAPSHSVALVDALLAGEWLSDWGGGLIWIATNTPHHRVREIALAAGGHAILVRAPADMRRAVAALHPAMKGVAALEARIRRAFDPACLFETGRFLEASA